MPQGLGRRWQKAKKGSASGIVELGKASGKAMPFEEPHNFLIDWSQPREELINQFGGWLDTQEKNGRLLRKPALGKPKAAADDAA